MKLRLPLHRKMFLYLGPTALLIFGSAIGYIGVREKNNALSETIKMADMAAQDFATNIRLSLNVDADISRGVAQSLNSFDEIQEPARSGVIKEALRNVLTQNNQMLSFWMFIELNYIDPNYTKDNGRVGYTYYRDINNAIKFKQDTLDTGKNIAQAYAAMKKSKVETVLEPYTYSYTGNKHDEILETSICIPILKDGNFVGLLGTDLSLNRYKDLLNKFNLGNGSYSFLVSNKGIIIDHPDAKVLGKSFSEVFSETDQDNSVSENIEQGREFSYKTIDSKGNEIYCTHVPIIIGTTETPWSLAVCVPFNKFTEAARRVIILAILIGIIGMLASMLVIYLLARNITHPLKIATRVLKKLSKGEIDREDKLNIETGDELEDIAISVNQLIEGLNNTAEFALTIGKGDLNASFDKLSDYDKLGNALLEMRQSLITADEEDKNRKIEDDKQNWTTHGVAKFGEILRQHNQEIEELSFNIMSNLVDYVDATQGGIFVRNEDEEGEVYFELTGAIAYDRKKTMEKKFRIGESLIGRCAYEKLTIYMEEVPDDYVFITSGLGEANPRSVLIVPAILNDEIYAIIELVSFNKFQDHEIKFVEKIGESIASTIANARVNSRTNKLLEQSKQQSEELAAQEEEMRQNLEELQATQEEVARLRIEEQEKNREMLEEVEKTKAALLKILDHVPIKIFLKDNQGRMLIVNKKVLQVHNAKPEDLLGKSDFDFVEDKKVAQKLWDAEQDIIKSGKPVYERQVETINNTGMILDTTKYPFYIDYLDETGILGVQLDVTDLVNQEEIIKKLKEELEKLKK